MLKSIYRLFYSTWLVIRDLFSGRAGLKFKLVIPDNLDSDTSHPLVVMLHGCDQTAEEFLQSTGVVKLAREHGCFLLLPQQKRSRNIMGCWNWFHAGNQQRGGVEPQWIVDLVEQVIGDHPIAKKQIVAAGISAGGAMAQILLNFYPELFRGALVHSAPSYLRAGTMMEALSLMKEGPAGERKGGGSNSKLAKKQMVVIHGGDDGVVNPKNAIAIPNDLGIKESNSRVMIIDGLSHAWSGGAEGHSYSNPYTASAVDLLLGLIRGELPDK